MIKSPGVTGKSERAGHNSVALPTAAGRREGDRICPALTETFKSLQGDIHSTAVPANKPGHSGSEGTDSLSRESDQKLAALYCKTNRKLPFLKAGKGCFENSMK